MEYEKAKVEVIKFDHDALFMAMSAQTQAALDKMGNKYECGTVSWGCDGAVSYNASTNTLYCDKWWIKTDTGYSFGPATHTYYP